MDVIEKSIDDWGIWIIDRGPNEYAYVKRRVWAMPSQIRDGFYDIYESITKKDAPLTAFNGKDEGYSIIETRIPKEKVDSFMDAHLKIFLRKQEIAA